MRMLSDAEYDAVSYRLAQAKPNEAVEVPPGFIERSVKQSQIGGTHYKDMPIQPFEFCYRNNLGHLESTAIGYLSRWKNKGGIQDLEKAVHAIQYLIEMEKGGA